MTWDRLFQQERVEQIKNFCLVYDFAFFRNSPQTFIRNLYFHKITLPGSFLKRIRVRLFLGRHSSSEKTNEDRFMRMQFDGDSVKNSVTADQTAYRFSIHSFGTVQLTVGKHDRLFRFGVDF